jgi:hypothetical protein
MQEHDEPVRRLTDLSGNEIGQVAVEGTEGDTVIGRFTPGPAYPRVEPLFREFAEAVEGQALSRVDRLDAEIARLGLRLRHPSGTGSTRIYDVQLWDSERITYKIRPAAEVETNRLPVPSRLRDPTAASAQGGDPGSAGGRAGEMSQPLELLFHNVLGAYNALWELGGRLAMDSSVGDHDNWLLAYRSGLRGMLARIMAVDRHYVFLHQYQQQEESVQGNPNEWVLECEYHAGIILFGMDSSLECFVFAMNALGFAKDPKVFCSITDEKALKRIKPQNILGGDASDKHNPRPGYLRYFPRVVDLWKKNASLLARLFEYHEVTKHRSAVAQGGRLGELRIREKPKQPGRLASSTAYTLQSITHEYQQFMDELLPIALEECAAVFGYTTIKKCQIPP